MMSYINETDFVVENKKLVYPEIVTDGLQLYYDAKGKRDTDYHRDTMLDMSGNKNHGKLHNFAYEKHSGYKDGLVFDYIDDKLVRPTLNLKPDDFTFMLNGNIISFSPDGTVRRVQDGEVIESKGFNLIKNGDFSQGMSGWGVFTQSSVNAINGGLEWSKTSAPNIIRTDYYIDIIATQKYYIKTSVKSTSAQARINVYFRTATSITSNLTSDEIVPTSEINYSGILTATATVKAGLFLRDMGTMSTAIIDNVICINLTATFGAGNEPTKEQMDEIINRFGFIPNAQDLIDPIEYKGNMLGDMENIIDGLYKTEVLSGTEIFTDKADDSVVHVEVDGKSYQNTGSGKNLFNITKTTPYNMPSVIKEREWYVANDGSYGGIIFDKFETKVGKTYTISFTYQSSNNSGHYTITNVVGTATGGRKYQSNKSLGLTTDGLERRGSITFTADANENISISLLRSGTAGSISYKDIQVEEGSTATAYEPPTPTPDYQIEIHSLNNVDVVSSVGRENLLSYNYENYKKSTYDYTELSDKKEPFILKLYEKDSTIDMSGIYFGFTTVGKDATSGVLWAYANGSKTSRLNKKLEATSDGLRFFSFYPNTKKVWDTILARYDLKIEKGSNATPWTPAPEDITENSNHPLIDKINLSLSEPLRSVGDVKDRLFRDSDGLWKIERKTTERIISGGMAPYRYSLGAEGINTFYTSFPNAKLGTSTSVSSHFKNVNRGWDYHEHGIGYSDHASAIYKYFYFPDSLTGISELDSGDIATQKINNWLALNPVSVVYQLANPVMEALAQPLQDKLNNLRSFQDSNYVYTVINDKTDILSDNLKPTLHAKFLYNNWYKEDRVINNLMIYNRALTNEEMLQNYKTIKRRWGM